jgi:hypothetical protein
MERDRLLRLLIMAILMFASQPAKCQDYKSLKDVTERFGSQALVAIHESESMELYQISLPGWKPGDPDQETNKLRHWTAYYPIHSEPELLTSDQQDTARRLLVSEWAYWDVPPGETLMCLFITEFALSIDSGSATYVALFSGGCSQLTLVDNWGRRVGFGMLQEEEKQQWNRIFEELKRDE